MVVYNNALVETAEAALAKGTTCTEPGAFPFTAVDNAQRKQERKLRVALYSHDTMGLGHMRRNLAIARSISSSSLQANVLIVAGANIATGFAMPEGVDCLTLPALYKNADGEYQSRSLVLSLPELIDLRAKTISAALIAYQPDVLIVDNVPRGVDGELDETLQQLKKHSNTSFVLGLRDVLDDPAVVQREWKQRANDECIEKYYDAIWVYGDRRLYDPIRAYKFTGQTAGKIRYTGYLDRSQTALHTGQLNTKVRAGLDMPEGDIVLCMAGGGQDGGKLARMFLDAMLPDNTNSLILTGPYMPSRTRQELHARAAGNPRLRVLDFHPEPTTLINCVDRIISMGGYNTVSEILSLGKSALIVPRINPRCEQMIRAKRLKELGLIELAHPELITSELITDWLNSDQAHIRRARDVLDFNGLLRLPQMLEELLPAPANRAAVCAAL
jgi:predicted glycosyltransferase